MVQTSFTAGDGTTLASVLLDISSGADAAINTAYTITMTQAILAASESVSLESGSSVTLEGSFPFIINAFTVTGSLISDLNFSGTVTLDNGIFNNDSLTTNSGGTIVSGLYTGTVLGTSGDAGDSAINSGTISYTGPYAAVQFGSGTVQNGWNGPATALISGAAAGVYLQGSGLVQNGGSIGASGVSAAGVFITDAGTVDNGQIGDAGAAISGGLDGVSILGAGVIVNDGSLAGSASDGVYLGSGTVTNGQLGDSTALISGGTADSALRIATGLGTVANFGTITSTGTYGVLLSDGGTIANGATDDTAAQIIGAYDGVLLTAAGDLTNDGTVQANGSDATNDVIGVWLANGGSIGNASTAAVISGLEWGALVEGAVGTITNLGSIQAGAAAGLGVDLTAGGTVVNGTGAGAAASIAGGYDGVRISAGAAGAGASVVNDGTITGNVGVDFRSGTTAVGTVTNDGLIQSTEGAGGYAVEFGSGSETLVLRPSGAFDGGVLGDNAAGSSTTLELATDTNGTLSASGADSGTVSDAAGSFAFSAIGTIAIDPDANWTALAPGTLDTIVNAGAFSVAGGAVTATDLLSNSGEMSIARATLTVNAGITDLGEIAVSNAGVLNSLAGLDVDSGPGAGLQVVGAGASVAVAGLLDIGQTGAGVLSLSGGAKITAGSLVAGNAAAAVGQISLAGTGTELSVTNAATVANGGLGVLSVLSGATFAAASLTVGNTGNSQGAVVVSGANSVIQIAGALNIGTALGSGALTVGPGAAVHAGVVKLLGEAVLQGGLLDPAVEIIGQGQTASGYGTIAAGTIVDQGMIEASGMLRVDGTVLGGDGFSVNGTAQGSGGAGVLRIDGGATLELSGPVLNAATTTFTDDLAPSDNYSVSNSAMQVNFTGASGVLSLDDAAGFAGTIASFFPGDAIVVGSQTLTGLGVSGDTLLISGSGGVDPINFAPAALPANPGFSIVNGNTVVLACFAAGTRIATDAGPVPVERLSVGDHALQADGGSAPIVWIGQRAVDCARHPRPETVWPVRVQAGAFGAAGPGRDLYLSPDHAVFVNNALVPVRLLINGSTIATVRRAMVTYFHVELPCHTVILAEGLPVESYLNVGDRADFRDGGHAYFRDGDRAGFRDGDHAGLRDLGSRAHSRDGDRAPSRDRGETIRLFPDFAGGTSRRIARIWEMHGAAPLVVTGPALAAARGMVVDRPAAQMSSSPTGRAAA